ncbi:hypothetical protein AADR41_17355 [Streptomyces sp. CLV115]|uniref:hypothetical protein n=1 Tax=Streptomyces sp. CLV115 TaxID=3138502 RepID=UPI00313BD1C1
MVEVKLRPDRAREIPGPRDLRGSRLVTAMRAMPVTTAPPGARYPAPDERLHFVGPEESGNNVSMPIPPGSLHLGGHRPTVGSKGVERSFGLRPGARFRALRDAAGRDRTAAGRKLPPNGTPDEPPRS